MSGIISPISQMRQLRLRELSSCSNKSQSWNGDPGLALDPERPPCHSERHIRGLSLSPLMLPPAAERTRSLFSGRVELATQDGSRLAAAGHPADIYLESWVLKRRAICLKAGKRAWALSPLNAHQRRSPHNHYGFQGNSRNSGPVSCSSSLGQRLVAWQPCMWLVR